jgi:hypothetical protein
VAQTESLREALAALLEGDTGWVVVRAELTQQGEAVLFEGDVSSRATHPELVALGMLTLDDIYTALRAASS